MLELSKQKILNKNKVLCEKYPFLVPRWGYDERTPDDYDYSYTWLDSLPVGWRTLAIMMCEELREELIRCNFLNEYMIIEAKEKFGEIRIYDNGIPYGCKAWDIIEKYAVLSYYVCCVCGKPDVPVSEGWICPFCKECYEENYNSTVDWETLHKDQSPHRMGEWYAEKCKDRDFAEEILETAEKYREQWEMERKANANGFQKFK